MNISDLAARVEDFRGKLEHLKSSLGTQDFEWYRYDSLANVEHIEKLLTGDRRDLGAALQGRPVLDIGCADGDLAFFLESVGCEVTAIDYPVTNHNHMAGVRKLKEALGSKIEILQMDVDTQFSLPAKDFGLAIVLGAIYHLKNPFYLLEAVSKQARHTLLSTRIARQMPGIPCSLQDVSVAYLLGASELNLDNSNFWIFTEASFRQMLKRTNWDILDLKTFGDTKRSNPTDPDHDERVFCFAQSRYAMANMELLDGWHEAEDTGWRWTKQKFSMRIRVPLGSSRAQLRMKLYVAPELILRWGSLTIQPAGAPAQTFRESGYQDFVLDLGRQDQSVRELHFLLDHAVPPDATDGRERGIVVHSLDVE